jgi:hypothetical protein
MLKHLSGPPVVFKAHYGCLFDPNRDISVFHLFRPVFGGHLGFLSAQG